MEHMDLEYLEKCKRLIEDKMGWPPSTTWKQRDYQNLVAAIDERTGTLLSVSTIRRLWAPDYKGTPQVATLNALAQFLDRKDWSQFKSQFNQVHTENPVEGTPFRPNTNRRLQKVIITVAIAVLVLAGLIAKSLVNSTHGRDSENLVFDPETVHFNTKNQPMTGIPHTVVFNYDVSQVEADSFFIQQSWDKRMRDSIKKEGTTLTTTYYYPGPHTAKLIANDSVIKETHLNIVTRDWVGLATGIPMTTTPIKIGSETLVNHGKLHVTENQLINNKVPITQETAVGYYYVPKSGLIDSGRFSIQTRIRSDSLLNLGCPKIVMMVLGENDYHAITLTQKGCSGDGMIKIGDHLENGKYSDLSELTGDLYQWQSLGIAVRDTKAVIHLNGETVYRMDRANRIGKIVGFSFFFSGTGLVDWFELKDEGGTTVYRNDFNG